MAALESPLQPHGELLEHRKLGHLTVQFADESLEYTMKGGTMQYELLELAIKRKLMYYELIVE